MLLITGMHRSGTSMTAQMLQAAGLSIGERLMGSHPSNPEGHFEDLDFYDLTRAIIADNGFPDSGFACDVRISASADRRRQAEGLVTNRRALGCPWGWKDPRSVLLLDFWKELLPEAHVLFTFRAPWEVMDSLYRRGDASCQDDPLLALRAWSHYNTLIRDFVRANPSHSSIFEVGQVADAPGEFIGTLAGRTGIPLNHEVSTVKVELLTRRADERHVALVHALSPASVRLYAELWEMAGSRAVRHPPQTTRQSTGDLERAVAEWARSSAALPALTMATVASADQVGPADADVETDRERELLREVELRGIALSRLHAALGSARAERETIGRALADSERRAVQLDHERSALAARASECAAQLSEHEQLLASSRDEAVQWQSRERALTSHVYELELACGRHQRNESQLSAELSRVMASFSWRLTAPLRALRRTLVSAPRAKVSRAAARLMRSVWRQLPMSDPQRHRMRDWVFGNAGPLLRQSAAWRAWSVARDWSSGGPRCGSASAGAERVPAPAVTPQPVRAIAMYLPQFHRIRENDEWWGEGFTEWTNVRRARPFYAGHEHPVVPHPDLGYYDLDDPVVLERQAALAREFGIFGFCFYYYWFGGRRVLERPVERMLASGRPDFPFCICWANEDWTRTWDGRGSEVLLAQRHSLENDERFIRDILPLLRDRRYIGVEGKPLLLVYRPGLMSDARATAARWREVCRQEGIGEIHLAAVRSFDKQDPREIGFDASVQFPPLQIPAGDRSGDLRLKSEPGFRGIVLDYAEAARFSCAESAAGYRMYRGVMPSWDNTARRMERATSWINSSPDSYQRWLDAAVRQTLVEHDGDHRLVFINAWNEWAEGAYLEPDVSHGYARLASTATALGVTARGLDPAAMVGSSLPMDPPALGEWMWRRVCAACTGELDRRHLGFLADYVAVLEQAERLGCTLVGSGSVLRVRKCDRETQVSSRAGIARIMDLLQPERSQQPFCFVVLQFNKWEVTARCVESIRSLECERPVHVVVVDNGSGQEVLDATERAIAAMPNVHLVRVGWNAGFAAGNNIGYRFARDTLGAQFVAVINNDTRIEDRHFATRCETVYREWGCSVIGPDILTPDGRRENPWNDKVHSPQEWREVARLYAEDHAHFERTSEARWRRVGTRSPARAVILNPILQGAALVFTPAFVGAEERAFDERTYLYGEEFLLAARSIVRGHLSLYSSSVQILHEEGVTTAGLRSDEKNRIGYVNAASAARHAGAELENALAASAGTPIAAGDRGLLDLLDPTRTEVLVDLFFCQPGYHGGGEYGKAVFRGLLHTAAARTDVRIWAALDPAQFMEPWVLEECQRAGIRIVAVKSYDDIVRLVNSDRFDSFFCPAIVVYTGYEYMKRPGGRLPFMGTKTRVIGVLHDLRDLQLAESRAQIAEVLSASDCDVSALARVVGSFLSEKSPSSSTLFPMYASICSDPHVCELITVSDYCKRLIESRLPLAPRGVRVLASPERRRVEPATESGVLRVLPKGPFALKLNATRPEKNSALAIMAFDRFITSPMGQEVASNLILVLVGARSLAECGAPRVRQPHRFVTLPVLSPEDVECLMSRAAFLLYPSLNEGFGYPPLEAMKYGRPSVVSRCTAIPEVCGHAAVYCDPMDVESIAVAMGQVLSDPPDRESVLAQYALMSERQQRDLAVLVDLIIG